MIAFRHFALRRGSRLLLSDIDLVIQGGWRLGVILTGKAAGLASELVAGWVKAH